MEGFDEVKMMIQVPSTVFVTMVTMTNNVIKLHDVREGHFPRDRRVHIVALWCNIKAGLIELMCFHGHLYNIKTPSTWNHYLWTVASN